MQNYRPLSFRWGAKRPGVRRKTASLALVMLMASISRFQRDRRGSNPRQGSERKLKIYPTGVGGASGDLEVLAVYYVLVSKTKNYSLLDPRNA